MRRLAPLLALLFLAAPALAAAEAVTDRSGQNTSIYSTELRHAVPSAYSSGAPEDNIATLIGTITGAVLSVLGIVLFVLLIYAGLLWMTAGGNPERVKKARAILLNSTIGLIITLSAYAIARTVINYVSTNVY